MYFNWHDYFVDASAFVESNYIVIDETPSLNKGYSFIHSFSLCLCLSVSVFVSLPVSVCPSVCLSAWLSIVCLFVCVDLHLHKTNKMLNNVVVFINRSGV